jgi:hypothetical protein
MNIMNERLTNYLLSFVFICIYNHILTTHHLWIILIFIFFNWNIKLSVHYTIIWNIIFLMHTNLWFIRCNRVNIGFLNYKLDVLCCISFWLIWINFFEIYYRKIIYYILLEILNFKIILKRCTTTFFII